jgi:hypothetical protein
MTRGLVTRIRKLETRRRNEAEILLLWRMPGKDVATAATAAKNAGLFVSGDQVISLEWLGDDPMPAPRWVPVTPTGWLSFTEREKEYCDCAVLKRANDRSDRPIDRDPSLLDWTEADLLQFIFGVET